jgi:tetratricopeptide (TPR) repeat protein
MPRAAPQSERAAGWRRFGLLAALAVMCAAVIAVAMAIVGLRDGGPPANPTHVSSGGQTLKPLAWPESPFLNTREGTYVGSAKCLECHEDEQHGYRQTGMGRSLATLDPAHEPPDAAVDHPPSSRRYEVVRREGQMFHRELMLAGAGSGSQPADAALLGEYPISHVIGSGRHSRSYLLEIDDFLVESPLTWYESRQAWDMSPGYNVPYQQGFQRPVDQGCLYCHVGRSRALAGTSHRMEIQEEWISCERCHGPGSLHVARHDKGAKASPVDADGIDRTIVNPRHLARDLSVDVCAQCHLRSTASIAVRGRELSQYRPGLPIDAFRTDYRLDVPPSQMTVVGHVEQLRLSKCFEKSEMTCVTCHNPHDMPRGDQRAAYYQAKCLSCHQREQCGVDPAVRQRESADNNCVVCHMPASPTDIPHIAFTHHRIGIHERGAAAKEPPELSKAVDLVALSDVSWQTPADRNRSLGGAYLELSKREEGIRFRDQYQQRAYLLLVEAWDAGLREPDLAADLAHLATVLGERGAEEYARFVLEAPNAPGPVRVNGLLAQANWHARQGRYDEAIAAVREVTGLRRVAGDWALIGQFELLRGRQAEATVALEKSVAIDPMQVDVRRQLIANYWREGNTERAQWHEARLPAASRAGP